MKSHVVIALILFTVLISGCAEKKETATTTTIPETTTIEATTTAPTTTTSAITTTSTSVPATTTTTSTATTITTSTTTSTTTTTTIPGCTDGTPYGQCSAAKPKYCDSGQLIDKCSQCGCGSYQKCFMESCIADEAALPNAWNTAVKLAYPANYAGWEDMAWVNETRDGMYFVYSPCQRNDWKRPGGSTDTTLFEIYVSRKAGGAWSEPQNIGSPVNSPYFAQASVSLSHDRNSLYFSQGGGQGIGQPTDGLDLFVSHKTGNNWGIPASLSVLNARPPGWPPAVEMPQDDPGVTWDEKEIYFYSFNMATNSIDIFVSTRSDPNCDACWSTPAALPSPVNTANKDWHPHISPDGKTLYFASDRTAADPYGCGQSNRDLIFMSRKNNDGTWSEPAALNIPFSSPCDPANSLSSMGGPSVTTDGMEIYFIAAKNTGANNPEPCGPLDIDIWTASRIV